MNLNASLSTTPSHWNNNRIHFFKYVTADTAKIILKNRTLRWSSASELNDPFDMQFDMTVNFSRDQLIEAGIEKAWTLYTSNKKITPVNEISYLIEQLKSNEKNLTKDKIRYIFSPALKHCYEILLQELPKTNKITRPNLSKIKILSLTSRPDNNLMWTHYSNNHTGVVLRFKSIPTIDSPYGMAKPMNYVSELPSFYELDEVINLLTGVSDTDHKKVIDKIIYTKSEDYAYEEEWRVSLGTGRNISVPFEDLNFHKSELDGVILGLKTNKDDSASLQSLAKNYPMIEMMKIARSQNDLGLKISPN